MKYSNQELADLAALDLEMDAETAAADSRGERGPVSDIRAAELAQYAKDCLARARAIRATIDAGRVRIGRYGEPIV